MNTMQRLQAGGNVAITLRVMSLCRLIHECCPKPSNSPAESLIKWTGEALINPQTGDVVLTPPSLSRWIQAFALRAASLEIGVAVVQRPASHRDKLGGVTCSRISRSGTTLTEVLMSLGIMTIGVVMVATVFPIATLRTLEASKQTNSTIAKVNAEAAIDSRPELIHNPDDGIPELTSFFLPFAIEPAATKYAKLKNDPTFGSAFRGHRYVVDPYGYWSVDPTYQMLFGNVGGGPWPASYNLVARYNAGFPDVATAGLFVVQPDNWKLVNEAQTVGTGTATGITSVTLEDGADLSAVTLSAGVVFRAVVFDIDGTHSEVRYLTDATLLSMSPPTVGWPSTPAQPQALPTRFEGGNIGKVRVEVSDEIYTWMLSVRKRQNDEAIVNVVVFFKRKFSGDAREERIYEASFRRWDLGADGVPGSNLPVPGFANGDDNQNGVVNDVGEIGFPYTDDTPNGIVTVRWPDAAPEPVLKRGGYVFDTANGIWYQIRAVQNEIYISGTPNYTSVQLVVDKSIQENNNDQDWNHNGIQDGTEAALVFRGGAILHPNVVNVFLLKPKTP